MITRLKLTDLVGGSACIDPQRAEAVYQALLQKLRKGNKVELSFDGVERLIVAFLNIAIGKLYNPALELPSDWEKNVIYFELTDDMLDKINLAQKIARQFYGESTKSPLKKL